MDMNLSLNETRVIGCLLEKESTTPETVPVNPEWSDQCLQSEK